MKRKIRPKLILRFSIQVEHGSLHEHIFEDLKVKAKAFSLLWHIKYLPLYKNRKKKKKKHKRIILDAPTF